MTVHGQSLALETRRLRVEGMTCAACVGHVERALRGAQGVASANVNLASESATVEADGGVTFDDLRAAVEAAGYALREPSDDEAAPTRRQPAPCGRNSRGPRPPVRRASSCSSPASASCPASTA